MSVHDNGRGITEEALRDPRSLGLLGMKERAALLGAAFSVERHDDGGTVVTIQARGASSSRPDLPGA